MSRTDNTRLPDNHELHAILSAEVKRPLPTGKEAAHYPDFQLIIELAQECGVASDTFTDEALTIHEVVERGHHLLDELVRALQQAPLNDRRLALLDELYDYLSEEDEPVASDLLFVFGARTLLRAQKAAELYRAGLALRIMVSGGGPIYGDHGVTEAAQYRDCLLERGVPEDALIIEDRSITVPDNVRRSLNLLDGMKLCPRSITLVNSPYAQRRGWSIFKKYLPDTTALYRVNADTAEPYRRHNWYKQEATLRVILNEFIKMRASVVYNAA